jgi:hypothetical protein
MIELVAACSLLVHTLTVAPPGDITFVLVERQSFSVLDV